MFPEKNIKVFPNPNNGNFTIQLTNFEGPTPIVIFNTIGQKVYTLTVNTEQQSIALPSVKKGIYMVKAINNKKQFDTKIVIQ